MTSTAPAVAVYRSLLRHGKKLQDYNLRSYAIRRTKTGFRNGKSLSGYVSRFCACIAANMLRRFDLFHRQDASAALQEAEQQLQVLKRQSLISGLYPSAKSVMESA